MTLTATPMFLRLIKDLPKLAAGVRIDEGASVASVWRSILRTAAQLLTRKYRPFRKDDCTPTALKARADCKTTITIGYTMAAVHAWSFYPLGHARGSYPGVQNGAHITIQRPETACHLFGGSTIKLIQQIGYVHAMDLLLTGSATRYEPALTSPRASPCSARSARLVMNEADTKADASPRPVSRTLGDLVDEVAARRPAAEV
jgi:hypothetical protein